MALTGDSYQWVQHAHLAAHRPTLLVADLDTFVISDEDSRVEPIRDGSEACDGVEGVVLVHPVGRFVNLGVSPDLAPDAERWQAEGRHVRVIRAILLD